MALANFFDRTATAAAQVLQCFDVAAFKSTLESHPVAVTFDATAARSFNARATLELAVNLLARLYPRVAIVSGDDDAGRALAGDLVRLARGINPAIDLQRSARRAAVSLNVGEKLPQTTGRVVSVGSDGWLVRLCAKGPCRCGGALNVFGAGAAACFGAANVFRSVFAEHLPHGQLDDSFSLSLFDYAINSRPSNPPLKGIDLGESYLVGVGAIGNAAVWALSRVHRLRGHLHLIDHQEIDLSNLQRYVLGSQADLTARRLKVHIAATALAKSGLTVTPHELTWGAFLEKRNDWRLGRVAVALDNVPDRLAVQGALPRWIVNAWTQPGNLGVSRHDFLGAQSCLACLYTPTGKEPDFDELVAQAIGLPSARMEVRELLRNNRAVGRPLLERIATAKTVPIEVLLPFEQKPLRVFYAEAVCGGIVLCTGGEADAASAQVPMAFQSALAGIMLAAELVVHAAGSARPSVGVMTSIDLLRPLLGPLSAPRGKALSGKCVCQDADFVAAYLQKYPDAANPRPRRPRRVLRLV